MALQPDKNLCMVRVHMSGGFLGFETQCSRKGKHRVTAIETTNERSDRVQREVETQLCTQHLKRLRDVRWATEPIIISPSPDDGKYHPNPFTVVYCSSIKEGDGKS